MDAAVESGEVGTSVVVAEVSEQAGGGGGKAREPHAMVAARTYLQKVALEYTVHKLPGMLTRTLAEWGKTTIGAALQARGVKEADLPEQIKSIAAQTLGDLADTTAAFRAIAPPAHRYCPLCSQQFRRGNPQTLT
jgi:DNA topoisomerase VI subunit B